MRLAAAQTCSSIPARTAPTDSLWMPMTRAMFLKVITTREQLDQRHTGDKAADMSPERNSTGCADGLQSSEELNHHPIDEHQPRRQRNCCQKEAKRNKREDAHTRV